MSDLHGENEAFVHILNSASGVIREKVDIVLGPDTSEQTRAEAWPPVLITPTKSSRSSRHMFRDSGGPVPLVPGHPAAADRAVPSVYLRNTPGPMCAAACPPAVVISWMSCSMPILRTTTKSCITARSWAASSRTDEQTGSSVRLCDIIKRLAVDKLHIVGDLFYRGPHPEIILDSADAPPDSVDIQWGNH